MITWWIVNIPLNGLTVLHGRWGYFVDNAIGPFWTWEEAQAMLDHWTK